MLVFIFYKECVIKADNENVILPKPLVFYEGDLFTIRFVIKNLDYYKEQYTTLSAGDISDETYADFSVLQPDGTSLTVNNVPMKSGVVEFNVTTRVSRPEAVGHNVMQIRIGNVNVDGDTSIITLPSFTFEIRQRLGNPGNPSENIIYNYLVDENGIAYADETGSFIVCLEN